MAVTDAFAGQMAAAKDEYSAGFVGTPWRTWGLFLAFAVTVIVFTLAFEAWVLHKV